ncbi:MAG: glutathione peroxidase, partial [Proteobacteria bacterium]|nr:glutathione peroxidase [Pseudomonadota bacterium]
GGWQPDWNFNKVLIGRDGRIKGTFRSGAEPGSGKLRDAIEAELARVA